MLYRGIEIWKNSNVYNIKTRSIEFYKKKTPTANPPPKKNTLPHVIGLLGLRAVATPVRLPIERHKGSFSGLKNVFFSYGSIVPPPEEELYRKRPLTYI